MSRSYFKCTGPGTDGLFFFETLDKASVSKAWALAVEMAEYVISIPSSVGGINGLAGNVASSKRAPESLISCWSLPLVEGPWMKAKEVGR